MNALSKLKSLSIVTIIVALVAGVLFIGYPAQCIQYISFILGGALILVGLVSIIIYFIKKSMPIMLLLGLISAITGIIVCVKYQAIISIIIVIFGVFILAAGIVDLLTGIRSVMDFKIAGIITIVLSIATIVLGILAITKSSDVSESIVRFVGVSFIIYAVLDIFAFFEVHKFVKMAKEKIEYEQGIQTDATLIEESEEEPLVEVDEIIEQIADDDDIIVEE